MTIRLFALLLACLISAPVAAQKEPAEVTDAEVAKYKTLAEGGCREAGVKQGDPKAKIDAFCGCLMATLNKSMSRPEWQQAFFYSKEGRNKEEMQVLAPHLKNVAQCRPPEPVATPPAAAGPATTPAPAPAK